MGCYELLVTLFISSCNTLAIALTSLLARFNEDSNLMSFHQVQVFQLPNLQPLVANQSQHLKFIYLKTNCFPQHLEMGK